MAVPFREETRHHPRKHCLLPRRPVVVARVIPWWLTDWEAQAVIAPIRIVGGLYRYVRNPMYLAVLAIICGQALYFGRLVLVIYGPVAATAMASFARWHEEPALARRFGESYVTYRCNVPGWLPRVRPWRES